MLCLYRFDAVLMLCLCYFYRFDAVLMLFCTVLYCFIVLFVLKTMNFDSGAYPEGDRRASELGAGMSYTKAATADAFLYCIHMPAIDRSLSDCFEYTCRRLIDLSLIAGAVRGTVVR